MDVLILILMLVGLVSVWSDFQKLDSKLEQMNRELYRVSCDLSGIRADIRAVENKLRGSKTNGED